MWSFDAPTKPGRYLFHGYPEAQYKGIQGTPRTEFVTVDAFMLDAQHLLFEGPSQHGARAAIGMWLDLSSLPNPSSMLPWPQLEVIRLIGEAKAEIEKPPNKNQQGG